MAIGIDKETIASWLQHTPTQSDNAPSPSRMIYELAVAQNQATALLSTLVGISSDLLSSSLKNTGTVFTELHASMDVSSANELELLGALQESADTVLEGLQLLLRKHELAISKRINKP